MANVVYYFSRTNTSKAVAEKLANENGCEAKRITDNKKWDGIFGFIKAGYYSSQKKHVEAIFDLPNEEDTIILVTPFWAGTLPPTVMDFINKIGRNRIILHVTSGGSVLADRNDFISVTDIVNSKKAK